MPNPGTYPHLWLWDSCFHAVLWAKLGDGRAAAQELDAVLAGQLAGGMVPHMRYGGAGPDTWLGPLPGTSSLTQPPMFGHAARVMSDAGIQLSAATLARARAGLDWLWENRRTPEGLIYVVHPWEAGNDHSPRWDDWGAPGRTSDGYSRSARTAWNKERMAEVSFSADGAACWSTSFVACPAAFNAYTAFNLRELAAITGDPELEARAAALAEAMDEQLWDDSEQLWSDLAVVGGGPSVSIPISDGVMGALVTADRAKARAALAQLADPARFGAPYGPANVARSHPAYDPDTYWRGPAWPPLNYLFQQAFRRQGMDDEAASLAKLTEAGAVASGWAEYWNPDNGRGLGAVPQTWAGLVIAMQQ
ncbi:MGH1-like glycoside hydrolase domain-containing protein [Arthrobacter sp. SD76]|uniref:MGH1-like glycoside hydrolase domain-containing protein n=1 Tax=Arthrobacter sp. SD76 TaxID=3415007 RepID=UPI003C72DEEF